MAKKTDEITVESGVEGKKRGKSKKIRGQRRLQGQVSTELQRGEIDGVEGKVAK